MSIQVNCDPELLHVIAQEASAQGCSPAEYVAQVISELFKIPFVFQQDNHLKEVVTYSRLFGDQAMQHLPAMAHAQRRHPEQTLLWMIEEQSQKHRLRISEGEQLSHDAH